MSTSRPAVRIKQKWRMRKVVEITAFNFVRIDYACEPYKDEYSSAIPAECLRALETLWNNNIKNTNQIFGLFDVEKRYPNEGFRLLKR
jgi:hypothetical protein